MGLPLSVCRPCALQSVRRCYAYRARIVGAGRAACGSFGIGSGFNLRFMVSKVRLGSRHRVLTGVCCALARRRSDEAHVPVEL